MAEPATLDATFNEYYTETTVVHNLGYRPLVRAWYEPNGDGMIFPATGQKWLYSSTFYLGGDVPFLFYATEITDTLVTFRASIATLDGGPFAGTFNYHYKIYIDPVSA